MPESTDSSTFNAPDADLIFVSSDEPVSVRFHIHSRNLEVSAGAFPPVTSRSELPKSGGLVVEGPVPLSEPAEVLEVLFAFVYPRRHPDLEDTPFAFLSQIAEAAEKYEVFSAMTIAKVRMKAAVSRYPAQVCGYAAQHDYPDIINEVAPYVAGLPLGDAVKLLPSRIVVPWVEYVSHWDRVRDTFLYFRDPSDSDHENIRSSPDGSASCHNNWIRISGPIIKRARSKGEPLNPFLDLDRLFDVPTDVLNVKGCCSSGHSRWKAAVKAEIDKIPNFPDFIRGRL